MRSRSRARARTVGREEVVVGGLRLEFGFGVGSGREAMTSLRGVWRGFLVLRLGWLIRWFWLWRIVLWVL